MKKLPEGNHTNEGSFACKKEPEKHDASRRKLYGISLFFMQKIEYNYGKILENEMVITVEHIRQYLLTENKGKPYFASGVTFRMNGFKKT